MTERPSVYKFEELDESLSRPPLAAVRFMRRNGIKPTLRLWRVLPLDTRRAFAAEGARDEESAAVARALLKEVPLKSVELVADREIEEEAPSDSLLSALGVGAKWVADTWPRLGRLDRFVLGYLRGNPRLLFRALSEIEERLGQPAPRRAHGKHLLARAEVSVGASGALRDELLDLLAREALLEGRGLVLARASGLRAGRAAAETFDLYAEYQCGVIELDWVVQRHEGRILWQAHASDLHGRFFPVASLVAATTAAVALVDLIKEFDPEAQLCRARLSEEHWQVGKYVIDDATVIVDRGMVDRVRAALAAHEAAADRARKV